jgi:uncharacterized protein (TIGR00159 family)
MLALRVADVVDIALVAFLLYVFFWWVRRQMSTSALRAVGVVTVFSLGLYLPARLFEMYMVEQISQLLIVFLLLATIVIFQSDLRRILYSAGAQLFGQAPAVEQDNSSTIDQLVESASTLADTSTGALIAIRGQDPWEPYIQGGIDLDGVVSSPLLYSIFDPETAGHDGAVLLEGVRVKSFGAHLPLAEDLPRESQYGGTRHAAALGLADVCDAFVIVVSEEQGTISIAHQGTLRTVESAADLKIHLSQFWKSNYSASRPQIASWWSWRTLQTAVVSVGISVLLWFSFVYNPDTVYQSFDVPIEYHDVPSTWAFEEGPSTAQITLSGPEQAFRAINPSQLAISFSLDEPQEGPNELIIEERNLDLPGQLSLETATPKTITVTTYPLQPTTLPVSVQTEGSVPDSLELIGVEASPDSVTVLTPKGTVYREVPTNPVVLDSIRTETTIERSLDLSTDMQLPDTSSSTIEVRIVVRPPSDSN